MSVDLAPGWKTELAYGPDWLFVKLYGPSGRLADATGIAECLADLMRQDGVRRLVLDLDGVREMPEDLLAELFILRDMVAQEEGILRICGLHKQVYRTLKARDGLHYFPPYRCQEEAICGFYRPNRPR